MSQNTEKLHRDIVVIGSSAGGIEALVNLAANLPTDFSATIFVVQHMPAFAESNLAKILNRKSTIPVEDAKDGATVEVGKIYCSQVNKHLILENGKMLLTKGPKENRFRPSIDTLFRSAAYEYKQRVIGVVLSGALNDGTAGMCTIKRLGGLVLTQSSSDALFDSMPTEVGKYTEVDFTLTAPELGKKIGVLTAKPVPALVSTSKSQEDMLKMEIEIAKNKNALDMGVFDNRHYTPLTCPDCHGALVKMSEGGIIRFRCHTGHAFTTDALLAGVTENIEKDLWKVMRGMEEGEMVLKTLAAEFKKIGELSASVKFQERAESFIHKSKQIHSIINNIEVLSTGNI